MLDAKVNALLTGDATLTAIVPAVRIYPEFAEHDSDLPYVAYSVQLIGSPAATISTGATTLHEYQILVGAKSLTFTQSVTVNSRIVTLLNGYRSVADDIQGIFLDSRERQEIDFAFDTVSQFRAFYNGTP